MLEDELRSIITAEVNKSVKRHLAELEVTTPEKSVCHDQSRLAPLDRSSRNGHSWTRMEQLAVNTTLQNAAYDAAGQFGRTPHGIKWRWLKDLEWELRGKLI